MRRTALLFLALMWLAPGALCLAAENGPPANTDPEQPQREVGFSSGQAAADCVVLAEEMEINFGLPSARDAVDAQTVLDGVARQDVPVVLDAMAKLRSTGRADVNAGVEKITSLQGAILARLRALMKPTAGSLGIEELKERAKAAAQAESRTKAASARFAPATLGKSESALTPEERAAIDRLTQAQSKVAGETAALEESARRLAADARAGTETKERVAAALKAADLPLAAREAEESSRAIAANKLGEAIGLQDSALRRLEAFRNALEGREASGSMSERLAALAAEERKLANEADKASRPDSAALANRQEQIRRETERLDSDMPRESIARSYTAAARDEMQKAAEALSKAAGRDGKSSPLSPSDAAAGQRKSADYLDGARKALDDAALAELWDQIQDSLDTLNLAQTGLDALDELIKNQKALQQRTQSAQPRSEALRKMTPEQDALRNGALQLAGAPKDSDSAKIPPGGRQPASGNSAAQSEKLAEAAKSMRAASESLSQSRGRMAASHQDKAIEALEAARDAQAGRIAGLCKSLGQSAGAGQRAAPRPVPPGLEAALSQMAQADGSKPALSAAGVKGPLASRPQQPSTGRGASAAGLRGLSPGTTGPIGSAAAGDAWQAQLPPGTPYEIVQSASGAFPKGYEEVLRRYYETIARQ